MILDVATASIATPAEAAKTYGTSVHYIYKLACRDKWRRIRFEGRVYYDWSDVDRSLGRD